MFCFKCGKKIANDSLFCKFCGVAVAQHDAEQDGEGSTDTTKIKGVSERGKKQRMEKVKTAVIILLSVAVLARIFAMWIVPKVIRPNKAYALAEQHFENGEYILARRIFEALGDYKDSAERASACTPQPVSLEALLSFETKEDVLAYLGEPKQEYETLMVYDVICMDELFDLSVTVFDSDIIHWSLSYYYPGHTPLAETSPYAPGTEEKYYVKNYIDELVEEFTNRFGSPTILKSESKYTWHKGVWDITINDLTDDNALAALMIVFWR